MLGSHYIYQDRWEDRRQSWGDRRDGEMDEKLMRRHISEGRRRDTDGEKTRGRMGIQTSDRWKDRRETDGKAGIRQMGRRTRDREGDRLETDGKADKRQMGRHKRNRWSGR